MSTPLLISDVGAILDLSDQGVRRLDDELAPARAGKSRVRVYRPEVVWSVAARRESDRRDRGR